MTHVERIANLREVLLELGKTWLGKGDAQRDDMCRWRATYIDPVAWGRGATLCRSLRAWGAPEAILAKAREPKTVNTPRMVSSCSARLTANAAAVHQGKA